MPTSSSSVVRMHRSGIRELMELAMEDPTAIRLELGEPDVLASERSGLLEGLDRLADLVQKWSAVPGPTSGELRPASAPVMG